MAERETMNQPHSLASRRAAFALPVPALDRRLRLAKGEVLKVARCAGMKMEAVSGRLWITETPGRNDILLAAGQQVRLGATGPWVIEALCEAEFELQ